jgi:uncharacterized repeat protein (TIGR03803 family)
MIRLSVRMLVACLALWMSACGGGGGSSTPGTISVPDVVGQTQAAASSAITGADLVVGTVTTESSNTVASGIVISQSPAGSTAVASGSAVNLIVSSGPAGATVPNVVGLTQAAANSAITGADLVVGTVTTESSNTVPSGTVISQSPAGGTAVASGSAVNLIVSSGPAGATVPNVVGKTQAAATTAITGADLVVGTVTTESSNTVPSGTVISQSPAGGTAVASGSAVNLIVSSGPAGVTVPNVVGKTQAAATTAITGAGLVVGTVTTASSSTVASGSVISQSPAGGSAAASGSAVNLVVSTGPATAAVETILYSFGASAFDGQGPQAGLVQGPNGNYYGTTSSGGEWDEGTVFNVTPAGAYTLMYSFTDGANPPPLDGAFPTAALILAANGNFYGTTFSGPDQGTSVNDGTVFEITPAGAETLLYSFGASATDGQNPTSRLIQGTDGNFYGTTELGGTHCNSSGIACGTFFKVTPAGVETVLYNFGATSTDANTPEAGLILGANGNFYGTTILGGAHGDGTVFMITPAGVETVLYSFGASITDGIEPKANLILGTDGNFYGTTSTGGAHVSAENIGGTVFKITPAGLYSVLYSFGASSTDAVEPVAGLIQGADGNFYGTTASGGANGQTALNSGTVFMLTPAGVETVLHSFGVSSTDGSEPEGSLIQDAAGNLYGTTFMGGANGDGTVFKITL